FNRRNQIVNQCSRIHPSSPCVNSYLAEQLPERCGTLSSKLVIPRTSRSKESAFLNSFRCPQFRAAGPRVRSDLFITRRHWLLGQQLVLALPRALSHR